jgi:hypothetical protein
MSGREGAIVINTERCEIAQRGTVCSYAVAIRCMCLQLRGKGAGYANAPCHLSQHGGSGAMKSRLTQFSAPRVLNIHQGQRSSFVWLVRER